MSLEAGMSATTHYERRGDKLVAVRRVVDHQSGKPVAVRITEMAPRGGRYAVPDAWRSVPAARELDRAELLRLELVREVGHGLPFLPLRPEDRLVKVQEAWQLPAPRAEGRHVVAVT